MCKCNDQRHPSSAFTWKNDRKGPQWNVFCMNGPFDMT